MNTITATDARSHLFDLIKRAARTHQPYCITSRAGETVLMSKEDFESLIETLELLSTPGVLAGVRRAKKDIAKGRTYSLSQVFGA
ncbi:MAG: type II toxin-antitoxin system Phd/YefM family antitoxin [Elusimicrobia bacterium]|nr:type II toxin-antitoxin system Phd/YefM family antitoxin [Elusimicrobiota bacterium]